MVEACLFPKNRLEEQPERRKPHVVKEGNFRRIGIGNPVPIFQAGNKLLRARIFWPHGLCRGLQLLGEKNMWIAVRVGLHFQHVLRAQIAAVVQQIVDASRAVRIFPAVGQMGLIIWPHHARVRGDD